MKKISLGNTDYKVSRIGFGGIPISRLEYNEAVNVVQRCINMGINFIDTAVAYGDSELKIGEAIYGYDVVLATKSQSRDAAGIEKDVKASLSRLKTDFIHLYQLHGVNNAEILKSVTAKEGALDGLKKMKDEGCIGAIGITGRRAEVLSDALKTGEFETVQVPYNFIETEPEKVLFPLSREMKTGIIAMKPFGGGALENADLALKYILKHKNIVPIPGIGKIEEMRENCSIAEGKATLSAAEKKHMLEISKELGKNFCRRCGYCMPCPQDIQIIRAMNARLFIKRLGLKSFMDRQGSEFIERIKTCTRCGQCESRCPYNLPIRNIIAGNGEYLESVLLQYGNNS
ncbi:MAG TPA: aldo/keto reductase [Candidatus Methanoperedens sp.]